MKITSAKLFLAEYNRSETPEFPKKSKVVGIRIYTDEGIYGDGEVAGIHATYGAFGVIKDMWPFISGKDPFDNAVLWDQLMLRTFWGQNGGAFWYSAVSAIDIALWDIKSKALNVPLYKLLGGKRRDKVRCYASQLQFGWGPIDSPAVTVQDYVDRARLALQDGYDAIKIDFLNWDEKGNILNETNRLGLLPPELVQVFSDRVHAVREAIGPKVDLIIENHAGTNSNSAIQLSAAVQDCNIYYFEEPNTPVFYNNKYVKDNVKMPLAHGERVFGRWEYIRYFMDNSIQVIQPDIGNAGGITETKRICDMAYTFDVGVQIHTCASHLLTPPSVQLEACIPNFVIHEQHMRSKNPSNQELTAKVVMPKNGYLDVTDDIGIGNEWSDKALASEDQITLN